MPFQKPTGLADGLEHESALGGELSSNPFAPATGVPTDRNLGSPHHANERDFGGHWKVSLSEGRRERQIVRH